MQPRLLIPALLLLLSSCHGSSETVLSDTSCWPDLHRGETVRGAVRIFFVPYVSTYAENRACIRQSYGVVLSEGGLRYFNALYESELKRDKSVLSVNGVFAIRGVMLGHANNKPDLISISELKLLPGSHISVDRMPKNSGK